MKHEKALAIRTITESMINAKNLGDSELLAKLKQELLNSLQADKSQPPFIVAGEEVFINEHMAGTAELVKQSLGDQVLLLVGDDCPHCYIVSAMVNNEQFPGMTDEDFCVGLAEASSFEALAAIMRDVADSLKERVEAGNLTDLKTFTKRYADFSMASVAAHKRLQASGVAPKLDPIKQMIADILSETIKVKAGKL